MKIKGNKCHPIEQQRNRLSYWICILFFEKLNRYLIAFVPFRAIAFLSNVTLSIGKNILFESSSCQLPTESCTVKLGIKELLDKEQIGINPLRPEW